LSADFSRHSASLATSANLLSSFTAVDKARLLPVIIAGFNRMSRLQFYDNRFPFRDWYNSTMLFEYDPQKSEGNRLKHGISFKEAQALWNDNSLIKIPARDLDEPRTMMVGKIKDKYWSAVITYRGDKIRIISVRRSRKEEIILYENESFGFR
jgi:uncharacterized protein